VLRWSALAFGVFYGAYHQWTITSQDRMNAINREYERKAQLIEKAKAAYIKKTMPSESKTASGDVISDPEDPRFDLEAYLTLMETGEK
ncbi:putative ATP synthase subunit E, mitochondrial, partial [Lineolata rhizophorae]